MNPIQLDPAPTKPGTEFDEAEAMLPAFRLRFAGTALQSPDTRRAA